MRKFIITCTIFLFLQAPCAANERTTSPVDTCSRFDASPAAKDGTYTHLLCVGKRTFLITYKANRVLLRADGLEIVLHKVSKGFEPSKVGAEQLNSFLSEKLQPYKARNILLYTTAIRSSGGSGTGQCGSGAEIYLHALDIGNSVPKVLSSVLIGSCLESIELDNQDISTENLGALKVDAGRLSLKFLNYKASEGSPSAVLSKNLKYLEFK